MKLHYLKISKLPKVRKSNQMFKILLNIILYLLNSDSITKAMHNSKYFKVSKRHRCDTVDFLCYRYMNICMHQSNQL